MKKKPPFAEDWPRLIAFNTVSRDSNLGLIEWVRDYLHGHGAKTRLTYDATGKKANLFATLGDSQKPGLMLSGHTHGGQVRLPVLGPLILPTMGKK